MTEQESDSPSKEISPFHALFENLNHLVAVARKKFDVEQTKNSDRLKWGRLIVQAATAYGQLYEASKIDEIEARVKALEAAE